MKNKYNISQVAKCYSDEIANGDVSAQIEEYLLFLFNRSKLDKDKLAEIDKQLKELITTNSEFFPEFWNENNTNIY